MAPSMGELAGTSDEVWGTKAYYPEQNLEHYDDPTVFFGLYGLPDFYSLWRHRAKKWILWAGSDIRHFKNGYWLDKEGHTRMSPSALSTWIADNCESWVENEVERRALADLKIYAKVCPSFMGGVKDFPLSYKHSKVPKLYTSVSGDNFLLYGWDRIDVLAQKNPGVEFHLYGNTEPVKKTQPNIFVHGRVPSEQMNEEIRHMQGALRLTDFDGFSEIIAKSILMGQWPISYIPYDYMLQPDQIHLLHSLKEPNKLGREHYLKTLNQFPWNLKK